MIMSNDVTTLQARLALAQTEIDELKNQLAISQRDAMTAYYRGMKDCAQSFEIQRAELLAHAENKLQRYSP